MWSEKNAKLEKLFERDKSTKNALALIIGLYADYLTARDKVNLSKAYHVAVTSYTRNSQSLSLVFCNVLLNIEMEHWDTAEDLLSKAAYYKNYLKKEEPVSYCLFLYLSAFLHIKRKKNRGALKFSKLLQEYVEEQRYSSPFCTLLLGMLKMLLAAQKPEAEAADEAAVYLWKSYFSGCRSRFLYLSLHGYFEKKAVKDTRLLLPFVKWGMLQRLDIRFVIEARREEMTPALVNRPEMSRVIYRDYSEPWILREIVRGFLQRREESLQAFQYYKEAELKQIDLPHLTKFLVQAAFRNKMEDVSRYSMEQFLRQYLPQSETDDELKAFVYHLLLTKKKLKELSVGYEQDILRFAFYALDNRLNGRIYNSVYRFMLSALQGPLSMGDKKMQGYIQAAEAIVWENLFCYHCSIDDLHEEAQVLYVMEKEKKDPVRYEMAEGETVISASGDNFTSIILGAGGSRVIEDPLRVTKYLENADIGLCLFFYRKGLVSDTLLIALAKHYMNQGTVLVGNCLQENPDSIDLEQEAVDILSRLLTLKTLSQSFSMQAAAFLGGLLATNQNRYGLALQYYLSVNENYVQDRYIEQMFQVFINTKEYDRAVRLIFKKSYCISDRTLFFALKQLAKGEKYRGMITDVTYELLLKSWYDKSLLDLVLENYNGSQEEWHALSQALSNISVFAPVLDEIILKNSIWMHKLDDGSQRVFVRMYRNRSDSPLVDDFVYYCVYEMMINLIKPLYETMEILEKIYLDKKDPYLALALSLVYLEYGITTFESEGILKGAIEAAEEFGLMFPLLKNIKDKTLITPYIEKNQAFMYRAMPDKRVCLYYKFEGDTTYSAKPMRYLRYGLYQTTLIFFYGDKLSYYFSEELPTGSITTKEAVIKNDQMGVTQDGPEKAEPYYVINEALIFERMFRYEQVESIITDMLKESRKIKGEIM